MPEGRQRVNPKADQKLKNKSTSGNSEYELQAGAGEEDDPDDESIIKEFIEASCRSLRHLISSFSAKSASDMQEAHKERSLVQTKRDSPRRAEDLVVLSVVLNTKQKQNDEVALAIERLRNNGVTCALFTMEDIRNGNTKFDGKISNGFSNFSTSKTNSTGITNGQMKQKLELPIEQNVNSHLKIGANLNKTIQNIDSGIHKSEQPVLPALSESMDKNNVNEIRLPKEPTIDLLISTPKKRRRKRRRNNNYNTRKSNHRKIPDLKLTVKDTSQRKLGRPKKKKPEEMEIEEALNLSTRPLVLLPGPENIKMTLEPVQCPKGPEVLESRKCRISSLNSGNLSAPEAVPDALPSESTTNNALHVKIPLVTGIIVENKLEPPNSKCIQLPKENLKGKPSLVQPPARAKNRKNHQRRKDSLEVNLAKFCLGDRATKSLAAERIKRCFKEDTKKQSTEIPKSSIASINKVKVSKFPKSQPKLKKVQIVTSTSSLSKGLDNKTDVLNGTSVPHLQEEPVSGISNTKCFRPFNIITRKRSKRRNCASPDIIFANSTQVEYAEPKSKKMAVNSLSPDISEFSRKKSTKQIVADSTNLTTKDVEALEEDIITKEVELSEVPDTSETNLEEVESAPEETEIVQKIMSELIDTVVLQLQNEKDQQEMQTTEVAPVISKDQSLGLLKVDISSQNNESVPNTGFEVLLSKAEAPSSKRPTTYSEDSLPDSDVMQLRRSSFYSLISGNVRTNMENYLDGKKPNSLYVSPVKRRRRMVKNGFLLHHGENCPEDPESAYKFHLATQVLLKLNKRRSKCSPKEEKTKNLLSYLKLTPKRSGRHGKAQPKTPVIEKLETTKNVSTFSGDWTSPRKFICGVCGQIEHSFWDMVTHKGENHPSVVVTHAELPSTQEPPSSLVRKGPPLESPASFIPTPCTKCSVTFSSLSDLHRHIFECAGNSAWLVEKVPPKRRSRRRRGFKRRLSNTPKKQKKAEGTKRSHQLFNCTFCGREFKTEGWLKNHISTHSLPVSIPLNKLPFPLPIRACIRKYK